MHIVTEDRVISVNNGVQVMLEVGDKVETVTEGSIMRKALMVGDGDNAKYYVASSAQDNWLLKFVERLCKKINHGPARVVHKTPPKKRIRTIRTFLDELIPVDVPSDVPYDVPSDDGADKAEPPAKP